jgi:hypothetical protein
LLKNQNVVILKAGVLCRAGESAFCSLLNDADEKQILRYAQDDITIKALFNSSLGRSGKSYPGRHHRT